VNNTTPSVIAGSTASEIAASVERAIQDGTLSRGDTLESVREMATRLQVSPATVASAYRTLRERGIVMTHERRRTRISFRPPLMARSVLPLPESVRDLASGNPDPALLPDLDSHLAGLGLSKRLYGEASVLPEVLERGKALLEREGTPAENIAVVSGGLDGIERVLAAHLKPGDRVAVEDPCYTAVLDLVRAMGLHPRPVAIDNDGPLPDSLRPALGEGVAAFVVTPRGQNPTGAALTPARARELTKVLADHPGLLLVEDDHAGGITNVPRETLQRQQHRWAVVRSITKAYGPDLRFAFLAGDTLTLNRVEGRQLLGCGWVSNVLQRLVVRLLDDPETDQLLKHAADTYDLRRNALLDALAARGIHARGRCGFNVWVPVEEEEAVVRGLLQFGWAIRGGEVYRLESSPGIRVTTSTLEPSNAEAFAADLARIMNPVQRTRLA
jgi:DNA-binding transcriptional MocR family regulator